jgi:polysaccharide biosynthesis/export protein
MAGERASEGNGPPGSSVGLDAELDQAVGSQAALAYVVLLSGQLANRVFAMRRSSVLIGRGDDADIQVQDGSVSAHHARIIRQGQGFELIDLDSTNGSFVRGQRVKRESLRNADRVTLGNIDLIFLLDRPTTATIRLPDAFNQMPTAPGMGALVPTRMPSMAPRFAVVSPPPVTTTEAEPSLADAVRKVAHAYQFVRERALLIAVFVAVGFLAGLSSLFISPPGVSAVAEVKLLPHMNVMSSPTDERWQNTEQDSGQFVRSAEHSLTSREFVKSELARFGEREPPDTRLRAVAAKLKVEETGEHVFRATYKDTATARPAPLPFLTSMLQHYVQSEVSKSLRELTAKVDFLRDQLKTVEQDLSSIGSERAEFREANADRLPEDSMQTHSSRFDLETRRAELSGQVHQLQAELSAEQEQLRTNRPEAQRKFQYSEAYRQSLNDINRKLTEAYARGLGDAHPDVLQLKGEKQRIEKLASEELHAQTPSLLRESDPNYQLAQSRIDKLQAQLGATRASLSETERSLGAVRHVVKDLPRIEQRLADLNHRQEATQTLHGDLFSKLKQAELRRLAAAARAAAQEQHVAHEGRHRPPPRNHRRLHGDRAPRAQAVVHPDDGRADGDPGRFARQRAPAEDPILMPERHRTLGRKVRVNHAARVRIASLHLFLGAGVGVTLGCVPESQFVWVADLPVVVENAETIAPRDMILVSVKNQPALSGEFAVSDHGDYLQPTLGTIPVAGRTTEAVAADLKARLNGIVVLPDVTVSIAKVASIRVNVVGQVKTPGSYELMRGRGVIPALAAAGWLTEFADRDKIFVIRSERGAIQRIRFRARELTAAEPHSTGFRLKDGDVVVVD